MKKGVILAIALVAGLSSGAQTSQVKKAYKRITTYTTAEKTDNRLTKTGATELKAFGQPLETQPCVFVNVDTTFQTFIGIGGAITDASAETFAKLPVKKQNELLKAYYDKDSGIGYTLARTNINSCDFSSASYTYVKNMDKELSSFDVSHDDEYRIPMIKRAINTAGGTLPLYVSPWSPPAWMKDNNSMLQGGTLKPEYMQSWANYYIRFIREYEKRGIPVWGLSVQNEPMAKQTWESCIYTADAERDFIKNFLGPTLHRENMADKKLIAWDHNRDLAFQRAVTIFNDPDASKYVWGLGFHWYETWTGSKMQFDNIKRVHETFPGKNLVFTEGCIEKFDIRKIYDWYIGERYGHSMVHDFNSGTVAWTDWNILLDEHGGPNHAGNFCFAPIHADTKTGELIYTNAYYYIGHFSKFIQPGAKRIGTASSRDVLETTAFLNPDGKIVVIVLNTTADKMPYKMWLQGMAADFTSLPHSIMTLILE